MAQHWARIWFSFDSDDRRAVPRRLQELSMAAQQLGFEMETAIVQDHQPEGEWEDRPDGSRGYAPLPNEHDS
jgi:hypothetical protein